MTTKESGEKKNRRDTAIKCRCGKQRERGKTMGFVSSTPTTRARTREASKPVVGVAG
jgi:hypothetical protein